MSKKEKPFKVIQGGIDEVTDEDFRIFMEALLGPYKGSGYQQE